MRKRNAKSSYTWLRTGGGIEYKLANLVNSAGGVDTDDNTVSVKYGLRPALHTIE